MPSDHHKVFYTSIRQCEVLPNLLQEQAEEPELGGDCVARGMQAEGLRCVARGMPAEDRDCVARGMQAVGLRCVARGMPAEGRDCVARGYAGRRPAMRCSGNAVLGSLRSSLVPQDGSVRSYRIYSRSRRRSRS
jgi:hypothetical protein